VVAFDVVRQPDDAIKDARVEVRKLVAMICCLMAGCVPIVRSR
jgi:hypothetical protein